MRIALATSEAAPFVKTGGLGDVLQALPAELSKMPENELVMFLPYYRRIKYNPKWNVQLVASFSINLSWREQYVGLFQLQDGNDRLKIYFIDNEYYFGRDSIYGDFDDGERFAYFSKAVLACLNYLNFEPDIIHCHDWQTALIPVFFRAHYQNRWPNARLVFTIHNVEYQGKVGLDFLGDTLGLPDEYMGVLEYDGCLNFMKGAAVTADVVSTVSQTYAQELRYPYFAHGLHPILSARGDRLTGITNGIDTDIFNPGTDRAISANYWPDDRYGKSICKAALQQELGLEERPDVPILAMVTRLAGHKGIDLLIYHLEDLLRRDVQLVIVGTGEWEYEHILSETAARHPGKFSMNLKFDTKLASRVYSGADLYLMPSKSEPCGLSQLIAMHYGTIPVVNETGGLKDTVPPYNPETGEGCGFTFQSYNADDFLGAIDRALDIYFHHNDAWQGLIYRDMTIDVSWYTPARRYMELYRSLW